MNNKKIGIIGGVGPQSTDFIYEKIIEFSQSKYDAKNNSDYPRILIDSVPVPDFISNKDNIEKAENMLIDSVKTLTSAGATRLCIGSNTVHILLEKLSKQTDVPFISMIELVANECVTRNFKKVALLGTPVLVGSGLYQTEFEKKGISAVLPTEEQLKVVETLIRHVIAGTKSDENKSEYIAVLNDMFSQGAEAIILGCTELPLAVNYEALGNKTINSDEILARGIVEYYYSE
jgi:aspartate racemase